MDQAGLAAAFDKSPSVISALVANTTGKHAPGRKFKKAALEYLQRKIRSSESGIGDRSASEVSGVDQFVDRADDLTLEQWKHRAIFLEDRLKQLQANMRSALQLSEVPIPKVSSGKRLSEDQAILKRAGDSYSVPPPPPGKK